MIWLGLTRHQKKSKINIHENPFQAAIHLSMYAE